VGSADEPRPGVVDRLVRVAVPVPALDLLTYRVPEPLPLPPVGARVLVPLGTRKITGVVAGVADATGDYELRDLLAVLDAHAFLPGDVVQLASWVGEYYLAGPGAALSIAMPPRALTDKPEGFRMVRRVALTAEGHDVASRTIDGMPVRQREALALLKGSRHGLTSRELTQRKVTAATMARLKALGLVTTWQEREERDPFGEGGAALHAQAPSADRALTEEQRAAIDRLHTLADTGCFRAVVLHGVTGSGKTEIYLHLAHAVRERGRGVLMLVPEIALTPAVAGAFRARFGERVAIQHSGLSEGERHDQWHRIRRGEIDVVIGTRSAVFAPLARPGLIIVDEEHDTSYKQEETPRYNGRDVAVMRAKYADALVVLGSATPSLESFYNVAQQRYDIVTLAKRVLDRPLANVTIVNMREEYAEEGPDVILSRRLREGLQLRLDRGEQALVLLNRRGYAAAVFCRQCGGTLDCPNCSVSLTVHTGRRDSASPGASRTPDTWRARCHYCNFARVVPKTCTQCAAPYLEHIGFGTERVEAEIAQVLPGARIGRVDRDSIRRRGSLSRLLTRFARREIDVLVGTQMIAKGHDFPHVTLVGVISADVGLGLADFRAAERTFQLLTQVAGRAGRGEYAGEAVIQTLFPSHYSIRLATTQDYGAFFDREIEFRRKMRYPPVVAMINVIVRGTTYDAAMGAAADLARRTSEHSAGGFVILGPAPAPLTRLRGEHRAQFFLKGGSRQAMRSALRQALAGLPALARKVSVDVDPVNVL
jgi:primosomal protein N' (replication factor Y) (superfamily II helicase)